MRVVVRLFASLSRYASGGLAGHLVEQELPEDATVADLIACAGIPEEEAHVIFVNGRSRPADWRLQADDQIGIFPRIGGGATSGGEPETGRPVQNEIHVDVWLYGELAHYGGRADRGSYAHLDVALPAGGTVGDLLAGLALPTEQRGITFINGNLSAMPGLQPDLPHPLQHGDRVAFFHLGSMWPFQYRNGAALVAEMRDALADRPDQGLRHAYKD